MTATEEQGTAWSDIITQEMAAIDRERQAAQVRKAAERVSEEKSKKTRNSAFQFYLQAANRAPETALTATDEIKKFIEEKMRGSRKRFCTLFSKGLPESNVAHIALVACDTASGWTITLCTKNWGDGPEDGYKVSDDELHRLPNELLDELIDMDTPEKVARRIVRALY